jgi:citrate lyase beta subunit
MTTSPSLSLSEDTLPEQLRALQEANAAFNRRYPGERLARQPSHTVYGGGHLFRADTARRLADVALQALDRYAPDAAAFADAIGLARTTPNETLLTTAIYQRVREKLRREAVEDFRIDFEDGYGARPDAEEDSHVVQAAREVARGAREGTLPANIGIRVKPLNEEWRRRSIRSLDLFLTALVRELDGGTPLGLVFTIPKVTVVEQVRYAAASLGALERRLVLPAGTLRFEIMVELPQVIIDASGRCPLPALIDAGEGRISAAHFGTYDYTAGCGITAAYQTMRHEACQYALRTMQVALAGTGVWLSDGATTVLPIAPYPNEQRRENSEAVRRAWRLHYEDVRHSLANGFYQGWDLHPAQLPTRFAALFAFFLEGVDAAGERLRNFVAKAAQATLVGTVFDDAATGQGLLNYFLRAVESGALSMAEAEARSGLTEDELRDKSFVRMLRARRSAARSE